MWRHMAKLLLVNRPRTIICNGPRILRRFCSTQVAFGLHLAASTFRAIDVDEPETSEPYEDRTNFDELQLTPEMRHIFSENGEAVSELIKTLNACIREISDQYQHCIARQIDILVASLNVTVGNADFYSEDSIWDELIKYRVYASDLQNEFNKYKMLVHTVGLLIANDNQNGDVLSNADVVEDFEKLLELIEAKNNENKSWDQKLLIVHAQSVDYESK